MSHQTMSEPERQEFTVTIRNVDPTNRHHKVRGHLADIIDELRQGKTCGRLVDDAGEYEGAWGLVGQDE